jgi:phasin family protein
MSTLQENFLDPSRITADLTDRLKAFSASGIDVEAIMAGQRKNIEALAAASRTAMESLNAVGKRQAEILQETMSQTTHSMETLGKASSPMDLAAKQAELAKEGFERALENMRELAEMVTKAQHTTMDAIGHRVSESLGEFKQTASKTNPPSAPKTKRVEGTGHASS